jgi:cell division protein FtsW
VFCFILILVPLLVPYEESQTNRWSPLLVFQPSELVKLVVVCLLAKYYSYCGDKVKGYVQGVIAPILIGGVFCYLIHKGVDLGGAAVVGMIVAMLMFSSGARKSHLMSLLLFVPVVMKAVGSYVYRSDRIIAWQDPWPYASGIGMQIVQSYYAFANGGIFGVGPGKGQQKLFFLPEASTDYIFSIVGEEFGLIGVFFVSSLFLALLWRGFMIARAARTISGYYIALGMTLCVVFPAFFNMLVALSIIPAKGLPLPFFSFGGTSMMVSSLAVGVVLGVHSQSRMESPLAKKVFSV